MTTRSFTTLCSLLLVASTAFFVGCKKDSDTPSTMPGEVDLQIANVVGTKALALDGTAYATPAGETFTVTTLKYYVSNLKFTKSDGTVYAAPNTYFLVDQAQPASQHLAVTGVPAGTYTGVSFVVGVDAATTQADPLSLTGALNPANSMYWAWATGHIFMKMEGTVTSASPARPITCHIGGYTDPNNAIVTAAPALGSNVLTVSGAHAATLFVNADVLKMFDGANHITLSTFSNGMMPGAEAMQVAKNYAAGMFTVTKTQVN
jgi:hypothetical protein